MRPLFLTVVGFGLLLASCASDVASVPTGVHTLSGSLAVADISLARRGTHLLQRPDQPPVYLESPTVNLRRYTGRMITVLGEYEANIDLELPPVLVVREVLQAEDVSRLWSSDALGLSLSIPSSWGVSESESGVAFLPSGSLDPVVTIETSADPLPSGTPIVIDQRKAMRMTDGATGGQSVAIQRDQGHVLIRFFPAAAADQEGVRTEWLSLLQTVDMHEITLPSPTPSTGTGATGGAPCGGSAGILCPAGQYCAITDAANNIGICKPI